MQKERRLTEKKREAAVIAIGKGGVEAMEQIPTTAKKCCLLYFVVA